MEDPFVGLRDDAFRRVIDAIDEYAILLIDPQGLVRSWNRGAERINGYKAEEILGRHFSIFYLEADLQAGKPAREMAEARRTGRFEDEGWRVRKDGSTFWANVVVTALYDDEHRLWGFAKVTRDLTERKRAADEMLRLEAARGRAEEAARRAQVLDELMRALVNTTRIEETLQQIANVLVKRFADYVIVDYRGTEGQPLGRLAVAHANPELAATVRQLRDKMPLTSPGHPVMQTLKTGRPQLTHQIAPESLTRTAPEARELLQRLAPVSFMVVPLVESRGHVFGTVSIVSSQPERLYDEADLLLANDVAQRASLAIENARLWELERETRQRGDELRQRLEAILLQMPAGAAIADAQTGRFILTNRAYEEILGPPALGDGDRPVRQTWDESGRPVAYDDLPLPRAVRGETVRGQELRLTNPDGRQLWISCNAGPIRDPRTGEVIAGIVAFTDVTGRRTAEVGLRALAQAGAILASSLDYETTLRNLAQAVVPSLADWCVIEVADEHGELQPLVVAHFDPQKVEWARSIAGRWRTPRDADRGGPRVLRTLEPALLPQITDELLQRSAQDPEHLAALRYVGMTSALTVPLEAQGKGIGVLTLIASESRRSFAPDDVDLAREIGRRAAMAVQNARLFGEAQESARQAMAAVRARDEFISVASHELRTPLTALRMSTETVARLARRSSDELRERITGKIDLGLRQLDRLEALIEQLLDVSRMAEGRLGLTLERMDLVGLAREVAERFADQLAREDTPLALHSDDAVVGRWDRSRLDQVMTNLLSNALKYGRGKPITLAVSGDATRRRARFSISDQGIGIAPEDQQRIFGRYERAVPLHHFGGLGLGLWISRRMVEAMGGAINVSSQIGKGSTFTVELPWEEP